MTTDADVVDLIRAAGLDGPDVAISPATVQSIAQQRRIRGAALFASALVATVLTAVVVLVNGSDGQSTAPNHAAAAPTQMTSTARGAPLGPATCAEGFDVTPTGGDYNESAVLTRAAPGQAVTITVTMRVLRPTLIKNLSLLVGPERIGTDPFPALRSVQLFKGWPVNGRRLSATVQIETPGKYAVMAYAVTGCGSPVGGDMTLRSAQPIGYLVIH